jgi:glycosyltransferase involved in cell wall biosynthesis
MELKRSKTKIVVVGQTPPPFHGQAVMIEEMLKGTYQKIEMVHVRMSFSSEIDEVGKFAVSKILHLTKIILKIIYYRVRFNAGELYYPPSGANRIPFYRDAIILCSVRPLFKKVTFHFHAAGIAGLYPQLNPIAKFFFRRSYFHADVGIRLSNHTANDCKPLKIKKTFIIPNGIEDNSDLFKEPKQINEFPVILFVGAVSESKGVQILLKASGLLKDKGLKFSLNIMGKFESAQFERSTRNFVAENNLSSFVQFLGVKTGQEKFKEYWQSDIFCFPSFYTSESFPVVLLEASSFGLPLVSTLWRGIPSIVIEGDNGFLVPIKDEVLLARRLEALLNDDEQRKAMGKRSRQLYVENYTLDKFYQSIESALISPVE